MKSSGKQRVQNIVSRLKKEYPKVRTALEFSNAHELLFATILSAQCTDKRVNIVTKNLFSRYKHLQDYAKADLEELQNIIRSTGFYKNKAKHIVGAARMIVEKYNGEVPDSISKLIKLPGVGRKTANVVLGVYFDKMEGIAVDTHVKRLSYRLALSKSKDPVKIESDLQKIVKRQNYSDFSLLLIEHGRKICKAGRPDCQNCVLKDICPSAIISE